MLSDQADQLRRLVSHSLAPNSDRPQRGQLTVLSGCKGGVGTTTLSLNLAVAFRGQAVRVLVIDCNPVRGDLATIYRVQGEYGIEDVVAGRCRIQDAISLGPAGTQIIPRFGIRDSMSPSSCWQMLRHLDEVTAEFDQIVIDAGSSPAAAEVFWPVASHAVVVSTTDQVAFTDAYAFVKMMRSRNAIPPFMAFAINRYQQAERAEDVLRRLGNSCRQFLDLETESLSCIPEDTFWESAATQARSILAVRPEGDASAAIQDIATQLAPQHSLRIRLNSAGVS